MRPKVRGNPRLRPRTRLGSPGDGKREKKMKNLQFFACCGYTSFHAEYPGEVRGDEGGGGAAQSRSGGRVSLWQICGGLKAQRGRSSGRLNEREIRHLKSERRLAPSSRKAIRQRGN